MLSLTKPIPLEAPRRYLCGFVSQLSQSHFGCELPSECLCQCVSAHAHRMPTFTSESVCVHQKLLQFTFELNENKNKKKYIAYTFTILISESKQVNFISTFVFFQLRTAFTVALRKAGFLPVNCEPSGSLGLS